MTASSASRAGVRRVRSPVRRSPRARAASHASVSATLLPRHSPCCEAAEGPSPIHWPIRHVATLWAQACPGRAKLETSYWA